MHILFRFLQYFLHTFSFGQGGDFIKGVISCYAGYSTALFSSAPINYGLVKLFKFQCITSMVRKFNNNRRCKLFLLTFLMGGEKKQKDEDAKRS